MPRRSVADLSIVRIPGERPPTPEHMTPNAMVIWERITATMSVERICDPGFQILGPFLCQHIVFAEALGEAAQRALDAPGVLDDPDKLRALRSLLLSHAEQTTMIGTLCTKLRMTPQSRYTPDSTTRLKAVSSDPPPWLDWSNDAKREPPKTS